jgi:hypothetical protein
MANFIADPSSRSIAIDPSLKRRLGGSHDVHVANIDGMCGALAEMMNKLALGTDGKVRPHSQMFIVRVRCTDKEGSLSSLTLVPSKKSIDGLS